MKPGIGLTGGIGSGKSTAAKFFARLGIEVIDTDEISRELTRPEGEGIAEIARVFGPGMIAADGSLAREKMRKLVFSDDQAKKALEAILHPLIKKKVVERIEAVRSPYFLVVVPLLFESGNYRELVTYTVAVDCASETQISRTRERSNLSEDAVRKIMANQLPREKRNALADFVLKNEGSPEALGAEVEKLHRIFMDFVVKSDAMVQNGVIDKSEPNPFRD